jgi:hypothetical protein
MSSPPRSALLFLLLLLAPLAAGCQAAVSSTTPGDAATSYGPAQCIPLPRPLPSCAPGSYTFNCGANDSPTSLDPSLTCAAPVPDVDGTVDYCCTRS